jgi:hypothetical protein
LRRISYGSYDGSKKKQECFLSFELNQETVTGNYNGFYAKNKNIIVSKTSVIGGKLYGILNAILFRLLTAPAIRRMLL